MARRATGGGRGPARPKLVAAAAAPPTRNRGDAVWSGWAIPLVVIPLAAMVLFVYPFGSIFIPR